MNNVKIITSVCLGVLGAMLPQAKADVWNQKTIFTFNAPVEIPGGIVLSPGTYVFKLMDHSRTAISSKSLTKTRIMCTAPFWPYRTTV